MSKPYKFPTRLNVNARINRLRSTTNLPTDLFECAVRHGYALLERIQSDIEDGVEDDGVDVKDYASGYFLKLYPGLSDLHSLIDFMDDDNDDLIEAMSDEQDRLAWKVAIDVADWAQEDAALRAMTPAERAEREQQQQHVEAMLKAA